MVNYHDLNGKVVLITGASSGIGRAAALDFAAQGAAIALNYFNNAVGAEETCLQILKNGGRALTHRADVTRADEVRSMLDQVVQEFGPIDVLVNNAGSLVKRAKLLDTTEELWDQIMDLNLKSVFLCTQAVAPAMIERRRGAIVNVTSIAGRNGGGVGAFHYAAAKGGLITMTKGLAKELAPFNIRVNGVAPGVIDTPYHERFSNAEMLRAFQAATPMNRMGKSEEIATVILFLASEAASFLCGETIEANGGMLMD